MSHRETRPTDPPPPLPADADTKRLQEFFRLGRDAAFRSLGCETPEAQAALRELVVAARLVRNTRVTSTFAAADEWVAIPREDFDRVRQLAQLATPPEEGR